MFCRTTQLAARVKLGQPGAVGSLLLYVCGSHRLRCVCLESKWPQDPCWSKSCISSFLQTLTSCEKQREICKQTATQAQDEYHRRISDLTERMEQNPGFHQPSLSQLASQCVHFLTTVDNSVAGLPRVDIMLLGSDIQHVYIPSTIRNQIGRTCPKSGLFPN